MNRTQSPVTSAPFRIAHYMEKAGWSTPLPADLDSDRTLVLAFGSRPLEDAEAAFASVRSAFPFSHIVGCSTSGEINGPNLFDHSLVVAAFKFQHSTLRSASAPIRTAADSYISGRLLAEQLDAPDLTAVLVYSDGLRVNGTELIGGFNSVFLGRVVVTGGLAGDGMDFKDTWVVRNGSPTGNFVVAVGIYGSRARIGHGSKGGWDPFGPERFVTRSSGNVLFELDGQPALALYKKYLGDRAAGLPGTGLLFPLSLRATDQDTKSLVRTLLAVNETDQSMTFAGDIPQGSLAQLMRANFDRLITGAENAAGLAAGAQSQTPCLAVSVSCIGRRLVLGERVEEELESVLTQLAPGSSQVGFYSYGEISPYATGTCDLHNQTMTVTTISES